MNSSTEVAHIYPEVVSLVLAMWDEEAETIAEEASIRFSISFDYALGLVEDAIVEEVEIERSLCEDDDDLLFDWDGDALASAGFGVDEDY